MSKQGRIISDPKEIKKVMAGRLEYLGDIEKMCRNSLGKAPEGSLRAYKHGGGYQYAVQMKGSDKNITYIPRNRRDHAAVLAQKEYDQRLLNSVIAESKVLGKAVSLYPERVVEDVYDSLPEGKRTLVQPLYESDEEFVKRWTGVEYEGNLFYDIDTGFETEKGEMVRSKSEWMFANILHQAGIPYRYEYPLRLGAFGTVYPDFTVLNVRLRREYIHEHFGMMDEPEYAEKAVRKINAYQAAGYYPGENLIITMETKSQPLDVRQVKRIVEKYYL